VFSALGLAAVLGMFGFEQNILSEYSHSLEFRNYLCVCSICLNFRDYLEVGLLLWHVKTHARHVKTHARHVKTHARHVKTHARHVKTHGTAYIKRYAALYVGAQHITDSMQQ